MFRNRTDAGNRLATLLREQGVDADVVLAVPRGGLPIGRAVADALDVPLDIVAARKIGAPSNPELAIGAVASDGTVWLNDSIIDSLRVSAEYVERKREE
jgi:predicted phosphoribosyltransferase